MNLLIQRTWNGGGRESVELADQGSATLMYELQALGVSGKDCLLIVGRM
jgi:hypothetical protein